MAWTTPRTWADDEIITTAYMNAQIRDNFNALTAHTHGGSAGDGSSTLASGVSFTGLATVTFADQSGNPSTTGRLQRNGTTLVYYNGSAVVSLGTADASAGTASLRTLGTGATNAAAGNHNHTPTTPSTSALTGSDVTSESASRTYYKKGYSAGNTIDGTSKTVTPTLTANLVIISCFVASADGESALGKVSIKETVGGTETNVQTGITSRFQERASGSTIYCAYGADYIERSDRTAATYTYHIEADEAVNLSAAYLIATVVQA
tara:strand:- start:289 stop:1080 length:792 start_codon:yes stop_codon:yes gene_type:complete